MTTQTSFGSCMHDQMLESNRDDVKLEAMRCVTVMTAKGKLTVPRTLFPHIVKNVSSKNPELKKLIYLYLTSFADQEPDMALLPVATLQKSLKSPNPLVRSSALKVLTSMRLSILSAILMATLRNSVNDLSPYVRKTVAHSIIKIYRLEPELRSDLIEYIERLFNDKNSMVLSSAVASFEVVCPEKLDLVHKHYRRFCFILADCNEWGQTLLLNLLARYILKTYKEASEGNTANFNPTEQDPKILLRSAKPLVHSNNSAVVMAVIKLFIAVANHNEVRSTITRPLIRLLHSHREVQLIVLNMIEDLTATKNALLEDRGTESDDDENEVDELYPDLVETKKEVLLSEHVDHSAINQSDKNVDTFEPTVTKDGYIALDNEPELPSYSSISENGKETEIDILNTQSLKDDAELIVTNNVGLEDLSNEKEEKEESEDEGEDGSEEGSDENEEEDEEEEGTEEDEDGETEEDEESVSRSDSEKEVDEVREFNINMDDFTANKDPSAYREVFRPYIKSFFIKHDDCTQIRLAKLRILTNLACPVNVSQILRELQAYISIYVDDKDFVSAAIHAIGRCAIIVKEVAHTCLNRLTSLLSNNNEHIVSEAIVVLRSQIINKRPCEDNQVKSNSNEKLEDNDEPTNTDRNAIEEVEDEDNEKIVSTVIKQVTKLLPTVTAPQARATIMWILADFCDKNITAAKCAPEVLRSVAKSFCQEDNFVKLQSLTLASKFLLSLDKEKKAELYHKIHLLTGYLFSLAKYDINHDVRDRGRFLKKLLEDEEICAKVLNGNHHGSIKIAVHTV